MKKLLYLIPPHKAANVSLVVVGMLLLVFGCTRFALAIFAIGFLGLEHRWRIDHEDFDGGLGERIQASVDFYEDSHRHETNRLLHRVGIPIILAGTAGLIWQGGLAWHLVSAALFIFGWILNVIGHGVFEKNAPAFADDPLSFVAGPLWDLRGHSRSSR